MSHCGLGQSACNPVLDTIAKFRPAYRAHLEHEEFRPAFDLDRGAGLGAPDDRPRRRRGAFRLERRSMSKTFTWTEVRPIHRGANDHQAALAAGSLHPASVLPPGFQAARTCKLCIVKIDGRDRSPPARCAREGLESRSDIAELIDTRRELLQMLFVEGNHFCPSCEKSGNCQLQALAYDLAIARADHNHFFPDRPVDASHPEFCSTSTAASSAHSACARAATSMARISSRLSERGIDKHLVVNAEIGPPRRHRHHLGRSRGEHLSGRRHPA